MSRQDEGLRVLHVVHSAALGGGPRLATQFALADDGFEHAVASSTDGTLLDDVSASGIAAFDIRAANKRNIPGAALRLAAVAKSWHADVLDCIGQFAGFLAAMAPPRRSLPFLYQAQYPSFYADFDPARRARNYLVERVTCSRASLVLATNDDDMREFVRRGLSPSRKVHLTRNGVDCDAFRPLPRGERERLELGFVGRLVNWKGLDVLLAAIALPEVRRLNWRLRVIGEGPDRRRLEDLATTLELTNRVHFLGGQLADAGWFSSCDVIIVPSIAEPFGIVALEAMACGRCVIASAVGGLQRSVVSGETGFLVRPNDPLSLARSILALASNEPLRRKMGGAARDRVVAHFELKDVLEEHRSALSSVARRASQ